MAFPHAVAAMALLTSLTPATSAQLPACPQIFGHGGYPTGANGWQRDQVRQPNNPTAIRQYRAWGAAGVEADLQLTRDGTKAVMWHNTSTWGLSGPKRDVNAIWWAAGADQLKGRTITRGVFKGESVYTFRDWLTAMKANGMVALVEIKPETRQSLLSADTSIRSRAWSEVLGPVKEHHSGQEMILYSHDAAIAAELRRRVLAAGLPSELLTGAPVWPEVTKWEEPPPSWTLNRTAWATALNGGARRIATDYTPQFAAWLKGKCR